MSAEHKTAAEDHVAHVERLLAAERQEFAYRRDVYTEDLIQREARVRWLEAELQKARGLQPGETLGTLPPMPFAEPFARPNGWGRPVADPDDPLRRVGNLAAWARKHGVSYATVKRWKTPTKTGNAIPMKYATMFRRQYGVPYTYWPHGVAE